MRPAVRLLAILCLGLAELLLGSVALADVIVMKSGRRYTGTVTELDNAYHIQEADGKKFSVPKAIVAEHLASDVAQERYDKALRRSNLANDLHVQKLLEFANKHGLNASRRKLLTDVFWIRWHDSREDQQQLNSLAAWCRKHKLTDREAQCVEGISRLEFDKRRAAAGDDALAIARLSLWCEEQNLPDEAAKAANAAIDLAPDDADVRDLLGYVREHGRWIKNPCPWKVTVVRARSAPTYSEQSGTSTTTYDPKLPQLEVAMVELEFEALTPEAGSLEEFVSLVRRCLTREALNMYSEFEKGSGANRNSRLLLSTLVLLEPAGGKRVAPGFTSCPSGGYGITVTGSTLTIGLGQDSSPISRYMRAESLTALLIEPKHKERLTLMFPVPKGTKTAKLHFDRAPPMAVTIAAGAR